MVSGITQKSCGALFPLWPLQKNINGFPDFLKNVCFEKIVKNFKKNNFMAPFYGWGSTA